jgi:hypothetical protein
LSREEQGNKESGQHPGAAQAHRETRKDKPQTLTHDHSRYIASMRAEGKPDAEFMRALRDQERQKAVKPNDS